MIKQEVRKRLSQILQDKHPELKDLSFNVDEPGTGIDADLCSNVAFAAAKEVKSSPQEFAKTLIPLIQNGLIQSVEVAKNGFLNFKFDGKYLQDLTFQVSKSGEDFFRKPLDSQTPQTLIEFVSANPTGPLHIGHGRGAALGDSLARIYRQLGRNVQTEYYINDIGLQMQILADSVRIRMEQLDGKADAAFPENHYQGEYITGIAKEMKASGRNDFSVYPRTYILDWIKKDLEQYRVSFDRWFPESDLHKSGKMDEVLALLKSKNVLKEHDGALWFVPPGEKKKEEEQSELDKDRVLKRSDGRYTYFASDITYHKDKSDRGYRHCIDIWGHDHHGYVPRVEASLASLGLPKEFLTILLYQLVSLKRDGKRVVMSTRSGQFITLKEILDEVGADACRFFFAMRSPNSQLEFDVDLAKKQSNENPVYYVQYVHARICSIFKEGEKRGVPFEPSAIEKDTSLLLVEKEERELMKKVIFFEDVLEGCLKINSPHPLTTYLIDCSTQFHKFYDRCRVLDVEPELRNARFALLNATRTVVKLGLSLVGVSAPDRM